MQPSSNLMKQMAVVGKKLDALHKDFKEIKKEAENFAKKLHSKKDAKKVEELRRKIKALQ
jgi:hypothetical protein